VPLWTGMIWKGVALFLLSQVELRTEASGVELFIPYCLPNQICAVSYLLQILEVTLPKSLAIEGMLSRQRPWRG
jgi:hypothetical protein